MTGFEAARDADREVSDQYGGIHEPDEVAHVCLPGDHDGYDGCAFSCCAIGPCKCPPEVPADERCKSDYSDTPSGNQHDPTCPRCGAPLVNDDMHIGPQVPSGVIYARRFICGQWDDPDSPVYKACSYIQTIQKRYAA
jgi:hypothetical protein